MSRLVFNSKQDFLNWVKDHCSPNQYEMYVTSFGEIIMAPTKSTRSLRYGYVDTHKYFETLEGALTGIVKVQPGLRNYSIEKFDWDSTRDIGVKQNA